MELYICNSKSSSYFYKYANKKHKSFPSLPPLLTENNELVFDNLQKANIFNKFFQSIYTKDNGQTLNLPERTSPENSIYNFYITPEQITSAITNLPRKASQTPDKIPAILLKNIHPSINEFLTLLFNLSLQTGKLPWQWKCSNITPIFKKGSKNSPQNYRPIALTSVICRVFEKIIHTNILNHLLSNNLLSINQHGFLPRRSTITQLLSAFNDWTQHFSNNKPVHVVYTDLSKAFDKVSHQKLLEIVKSYGIRGEVYLWIENFLCGRVQHVVIQQSRSEALKVLSGVPQGSVLGPLLFLMFIDDLAKLSSNDSKICLFADDAKIYSSNQTNLQHTLDNVTSFFDSRQLSLATDKCEQITFAKHYQPSSLTIGSTSLNNTKLIKDLGVFITSDLKWQHHIHLIKTRAMQKCYQILRSFNSKNIWILLKSFLTFVRPVLEYASVIWSPNLIKDINALEAVQKYYTRRICRRCNLPFSSYSDRLHMLNLCSLEYRRLQTDLIMAFKITHNLVDIEADLFKLYCSPYPTRRHNYCLFVPKQTSKTRSSFFAERITKIWNKLPPHFFIPDTLSSFCSKLKKINLHKIAPLKF